MPNYVLNSLTFSVEDSTEDILEYIRGKTEFDFDKINPIPPEISEKDLRYWCIQNWGTKWNAEDIEVTVDDEVRAILFRTPWGPPLEIYTILSKIFPETLFEFQFLKESKRYGGAGLVQNGELTLNNADKKFNRKLYDEITQTLG